MDSKMRFIKPYGLSCEQRWTGLDRLVARRGRHRATRAGQGLTRARLGGTKQERKRRGLWAKSHCRSRTKHRFINLANSLTNLSTNRHLSIPIKSDSERCGTSFR